MKRILSVLVAVSAAFAAAAQDLRYSPQATADCLAGAASDTERRACIGRSAEACMNATPDGSTTVGMGYCWDREREDWDRYLNQTYQYYMDKARALDAEMAEIGSAAPSLAEALRRAQRAWIAWRDASCDYEMAQWGGGSGGGPALLSCLAWRTGEQVLYLQRSWLGE